MGINGRQWDTMHFHELTKPFQSADFRGFSSINPASATAPNAVPGHAIIRRSDFGGFVAWTRWFWGHLRPPRRSGGNGGENGPWLKKMGKKCQTVCKPGSVHPSPIKGRGWMAIHLGRPLPDASRDLPGRRRENPPAGPKSMRSGMSPLFGLAPGGVYHAASVAGGAVRSYRTLSPLPRAGAR